MAFTKTIKAAKAESFAVVEGGFLLEEDQLNNIENVLTEAETASAQAATSLQEANASIATLTESLATEKTTVETLTEANATSATKITELETAATAAATASEEKISALEAQVAELGKNPSGAGSAIVTDKDETVTDKGGKPGLMDPNHPLNQYAASQIAAKKKAKQ